MAKKHKEPRPELRPAAREIPESHLNRVIVAVLFILPVLLFIRYLFGGRMLFGTDFIGDGGYAAHQFMAEYIRTHGAIAFWQPAILCGQPTLAAFFGDLLYPTLLLRLFLPVHVVWTWTFVLHLFLAGLGTWLFLREHDIGTIPAALGGIAYMFAGSLVTLTFAGHDGRLIGSALLPFALFFLHRGMTTRRLIHFLFCGLMVALQLLSGHLQKVYYTGLILVGYFAFMLVRSLRQEKSARLALQLVLLFVVGMATAVALAAVQYLPIYGNLPFGIRGAERGYDFATSWSMSLAETFDLLTPHFSGAVGSYTRLGQYLGQAGIAHSRWPETYWGQNPFKLHSEYLGILPLLFALIGVLRCWRRPQVKFFFFSFLGSLVMAWGGNTFLYRIPYHLFPGVSKFRGPAMIFFVAAFSLVVLAGFGISHILSGLCTRGSRTALPRSHVPLLYAGFLPLGLLLFVLLARDSAAALFTGGSAQRTAAFLANSGAMTLGLLFAVIIWVVAVIIVRLFEAGRLTLTAFAAITALVMVADITISLNLLDERKGYIPGIPPPATYFAPDSVVRSISTDTTLFRVLPLSYEHTRDGLLWLHDIQSAAGSLPNPLATYQDFIGAGASATFSPANFFDASGPRRNFLDLLNIKYIIAPRLADGTGGYAIYPNDSALPRAFVAPGYEIVSGKDAVIRRLSDRGFRPGRTVLLYDDPGLTASADTLAGTAAITFYDPNRITVRASLSDPGILVLSENWHPDWRVTVDGRPARLLQAYHTLRAVALDPGDHTVEFRLLPRYYRLGLLISALALCFFAVVAAASLVLRRRTASPQPAT